MICGLGMRGSEDKPRLLGNGEQASPPGQRPQLGVPLLTQEASSRESSFPGRSSYLPCPTVQVYGISIPRFVPGL